MLKPPRSQAPSRQTTARPQPEAGTPSRDFVIRASQLREERLQARSTRRGLAAFKAYVDEK